MERERWKRKQKKSDRRGASSRNGRLRGKKTKWQDKEIMNEAIRREGNVLRKKTD